jgi:hypothetical protein
VYGPSNISGAACCEHRPRGDGSRGTRPAATGQAIDAPTPKAAPGGAQTPTEGLTTRSDILLMANENPTGGGAAVALRLPPPPSAFLQQALAGIQAGLVGDLAEFPDGLRDPDRTRQEADACGRLLAAFESGAIVPDRNVVAVLTDAAWANDEGNEYERVVFEHRAFCGLLAQVELGWVR